MISTQTLENRHSIDTVEPVPSSKATVDRRSTSSAESLSVVAELIRKDAQCDPLHYLLRSNTSHDGE